MSAVKGLNLTSTPALVELLKNAADDPSVPEELRSKAAALAQEENVSWKRLRPIYMAIRETKHGETSTSLGAACKGSQLVLPSEPKKERNPELVARLQKLQRQEDDRKYAAMVHDVTASERRAAAIREGGLVSYKDQISYGLHVVVVMGVFFGIGYTAASRVSGKASMGAAGGLLGLVLAMLMESILLIIRTSDYGQTRKRAKQISRQPAQPGTVPVEATAKVMASGGQQSKKEK